MSALVETLKDIEKRSGMYFGGGERSRSIRVLQAFILGCQCGQQWPDQPPDFDCFTEWIALRYGLLADGKGGFDMILDQVRGDDRAAFDEFFRLLPDYLRDREQTDVDTIRSRFSQLQELMMEKPSRSSNKK